MVHTPHAAGATKGSKAKAPGNIPGTYTTVKRGERKLNSVREQRAVRYGL